MKTTFNWLKDYLDIEISCERLAHLLTMAGLEVNSIEKKDGDFVFEQEVTPNRPDWLSVIGIARELSAISGKKLKKPLTTIKTQSSKEKISIEIKDKKLCPRYSGRVIEGIEAKQAPEWMQKRLKLVGLRPVNNIVDITNFCQLETGQPMHAFDYDKIEGKKIIVRLAKKGEKITTIDNIKRELSSDTLIIADEKKPIAIAGVMGGMDAEVTSSTKNILLESAYFNPVSVRLASRKLGLSSESSYRFERGVDLDSVVSASNRAALLISEFAGGSLQKLVDKGAKKVSTKQIIYDVKRMNKLLGCDISGAKAMTIFKALDCKVTGSKTKIKVNPPSFRRDLLNEVDLLEEAVRIYGYENIPSTIPGMVAQKKRKDSSRVIQEEVRNLLASSGMTEVVTYSLISREMLEKLSSDESNIIEVVNPLSAEQEIMRPTIIAGMLNAILRNVNRRQHNLRLFEMGKVYFKDGTNFKERLVLCLAATGAVTANWRRKRNVDFFDIKGIIETLCYRLGVESVVFSKERSSIFSSTESAILKIGKEKIGTAGKIEKNKLSKFDIKQDVYVAEIDMDKLFECVKLKKRFSPIPKFPSIKRDISIVVEKTLASSEIISLIQESGSSVVTKVEVFDEYYGKHIPEGKKGLSFSIIYQDTTKTLTDQQVDTLHSNIKEALKQKFSAQFR